MAVVDGQWRVHGLSGLRIADASIMPTMSGLRGPTVAMSANRVGVRRTLLAGSALNFAGGIVFLMTVLGNYYGLEAFALLSGIAIALNTDIVGARPARRGVPVRSWVGWRHEIRRRRAAAVAAERAAPCAFASHAVHEVARPTRPQVRRLRCVVAVVCRRPRGLLGFAGRVLQREVLATA